MPFNIWTSSVTVTVPSTMTFSMFLYPISLTLIYPIVPRGTGAVVLSGFYNAAKLSCLASGKPPSTHRILFFGAGSAGVGVAMQLMSFFKLQGLSEDEARERIWLVDSQGLVYDARGKLPAHKRCKMLLPIYRSSF
jgi:malate dehydrogenase (oxaloacetate-decarboxylating)(NADP+)